MRNSTTNTFKLTHLDYQELPEVAQMKRAFPFCKSAKVGNQFYPVIANANLMDFIVLDENIVAAARKVKLNAVNPSGSEHGIVKKVCDMIINYPSFRQIISHDLMQGGYCPERIVSDRVFKANHMTLPRGFQYTINQIFQTMIMEVVDASRISECTMSCAWSERSNPGASKMIEIVDHFRKGGFKSWISLNLKSFMDNVPHDRLMQKIDIMFQDRRVANLVCTLMGLNTSTVGDSQTKHGLPKDSPLATMLAYDLYLSELDQKIVRLGVPHVRYNDEIVVFCDNHAAAKQIRCTLVNFVKNAMQCPVVYTRIKEIAHLAFLGLRLHGGNWRIQDKMRNAATGLYIRVALEYATEHRDVSLLWLAYEVLTKFISFYEDVYSLETEIRNLKKLRDEVFTGAITTAEKIKLGIIK